MAENHLDFIFMKKDGKESQIYRVDEPELAGLLLAIDIATGKTKDAFNTAINTYLGAATATGLNVLLGSDRVAKIPRDTFNHTAEDTVPPTPPATADQFKPSVYFNKANDVRFGHMYAVTFDAAGAVEAPHGTGGNDAEYVILSFTPEDISLLKGINKGDDVANLADKIQLVTQSFRKLYDKIPDKTAADTKITDNINGAVADATFKPYCDILVNIGKAYTKTNTANFDGVAEELDISYPGGGIPVIKSQQAITDSNEVKNLLNFAITCLGAKVTGLAGLAGGFKRRRNRKTSKRRSQKKSRKLKKRSNKRKGKKSRKRMRKSYKK